MTKILVSYESPDELRAVLRKLNPLIDTFKLQPAAGRYKRAYLILKDAPEDGKQAN